MAPKQAKPNKNTANNSELNFKEDRKKAAQQHMKMAKVKYQNKKSNFFVCV